LSSLRHLPRTAPLLPDRPDVAGPDHPMRAVTRQVAFEPGGWTPERAAKVAELFDGLAPDWNERANTARTEPLVDALERGGPFRTGVCLEPGCGTGLATEVLAERFDTVVAIDLSAEMLARVPRQLGARLRADCAHLPVPAGSADVVVVVNCFLFPAEVDRVLAPDGALVWISSLAEATPIWLPADDVLAALPGEWEAVASEAGWGSWLVARRAGRTAPAA